MAYLTKDDNIVTQVELAQHASFDINTTSQVLRTLEKNGLIKRQSKFGNEKAKHPTLTELGHHVLKPAIRAVEEIDQEFFSSLEANELEKFKLITTKMLRI